MEKVFCRKREKLRKSFCLISVQVVLGLSNMVIKFVEYEVKGGLEGLLRTVFENREREEIALNIIEHIKKHHRLLCYETSDFIKTHGYGDPAQKRKFYRVLKRMIDLGMLIRTTKGEYILSRRFGNALVRLYKTWKKILEE